MGCADKAAVRRGIKDGLKGYAVHPAHVAVANVKVRPFTQTRLCLDYEV